MQNMIHKTYGQVIISERFLPHSKKSIKPVTAHMGGVAGGEKVFVTFIYIYIYIPLDYYLFRNVYLIISNYKHVG